MKMERAWKLISEKIQTLKENVAEERKKRDEKIRFLIAEENKEMERYKNLPFFIRWFKKKPAKNRWSTNSVSYHLNMAQSKLDNCKFILDSLKEKRTSNLSEEELIDLLKNH